MHLRPVHLMSGAVELQGDLMMPVDPLGLVIFAHGSGSSRHSSRNRYVAEVLQHAGMATLLFDLLTIEEEQRGAMLRFDIGVLAKRLIDATHATVPKMIDAPIGYFGASTGGGAALVAAAQLGDAIRAVVSRGGRPDLAGAALPLVRAATLLIVGGNDTPVIAMNRSALAQLRCEKRLEIVPGATHLFEEAGTLEAVARSAAQWFVDHFRAPAQEVAA